MSHYLAVRAYLRNQRKGAGGLAPIYLNITIDGLEKPFSLRQKVREEDWDQARQMCIGKSPEAILINARIAQAKGDLARIFSSIPPQKSVRPAELLGLYFNEDPERNEKRNKKDPGFHEMVLDRIDEWMEIVKRYKTAAKRFGEAGPHLDAFTKDREALAVEVDNYIDKAHSWLDDAGIDKTLLDTVYYFLLKYLLRVLKGTHSHQSLRKWVSTKNVIQEFMVQRYKARDLPLHTLQLKLAEHFKDYLMLNRELQNNTAMKYIKNLKQLLNLATVENWINNSPVKSFQCHYVDPERQALTMEEIATLIGRDLKVERLREVRDVFIFSCFTGFAYQEVYNLRPQHFSRHSDGKLWIDTDRNKTKHPEFLPLLPIAQDIITKYANHPYCRKYGKLLPVNSNQRYNSYLTEIADLCGMEIGLTTHIARHTFATTIALENDIPLKIVSKMLGHKSIRTTEIYAKVSKKAISKHMGQLEKQLFADSRDLLLEGRKYSLPVTKEQPSKTKKVSARARLGVGPVTQVLTAR